MNNNLIKMQEMLMSQMERLDNLDIKEGINKAEEISRANALSDNACTFIKCVNMGIRIMETSKKYDITYNTLSKELGIYDKK